MSTHTRAIRNWVVMMVNDDGREVPVVRCRGYEEAEQAAGVHRDLMDEEEVEQGWNYLPKLA